MASIASFDSGWDMSLAIFGLHLVGLGFLLSKSTYFPRLLGVLVVPEFAFTFSLFTFVGEALLILGLFWRAIRGFADESESPGGQVSEPRLAQPTSRALVSR